MSLASNQYTLFDSSLFSHFDCGSPTVKTYADKRTLLVEKCRRTARSSQQLLNHRPSPLPTDLCLPIRSTGFNLAKYRQWINITHGRAMHVSYYFFLNRKYRYCWSSLNYMLTTTSTLPHIINRKLLYKYDAASFSRNKIADKCNLYRCHSSVDRALERWSRDCWFEPTLRHYFSSNNVRSLAYVFTSGDPQLKWLKRNNSNRANLFETRLVSLVVYLLVV